MEVESLEDSSHPGDPPAQTDPLAPFAELSGRRLMAILVGALIVALLVALVAGLAGYVGGVFTVMSGFYLLALVGLRWIFHRYDIDAGRLFGPIPRTVSAWLPALLPLVAMHALLFAAFALLGLLSYVAPDAVLGFVNRSDEAQSIFAAAGPFWIVLLGAVVLAPIVEEIFFHRWAWKWSTRRAVVTTSVVFGLLHPPLIIPQLVAGFILARIYLVSGSLWVAIVGHALINFWVAMASLGPGGEGAALTLEQLRTMGWVLSVVSLAIIVPLASWMRPILQPPVRLPYAR